MNTIIVGHCWISGITTIGIVVVLDTITNEKKAYIGTLPNSEMDEPSSLKYIADYGTKFPLYIAIMLISDTGVVDDKRYHP